MTMSDTMTTAPDLFSKFDPLIEMRAGLLATGVTDPYGLVMDKVLSPTTAICNGRDTILLGTYNYMGMTFDPDVLAAGTSEILCDLTDPMTGAPANRTLGLLLAGDPATAMLRGFASTNSPRAFGHMGAGGQVSWADPATGLSFAYLTNGLDRNPVRMGARGLSLSYRAGKVAPPGS